MTDVASTPATDDTYSADVYVIQNKRAEAGSDDRHKVVIEDADGTMRSIAGFASPSNAESFAAGYAKALSEQS
jgi:hypothetical protein